MDRGNKSRPSLRGFVCALAKPWQSSEKISGAYYLNLLINNGDSHPDFHRDRAVATNAQRLCTPRYDAFMKLAFICRYRYTGSGRHVYSLLRAYYKEVGTITFYLAASNDKP
jgi:hypothetical protein